MAKLLVVVAMLLVQVQPVAGAVLCQRHHEMAAHACVAMSEGRPDAMHHGDDQTAPADHDCARMLACSPASPAVVAASVQVDTQVVITALAAMRGTTLPPAVAQARPFHPPRA